MNVTVVCEVLGEANNGTTIAAMNLINYLTKKGHNVKVVCPDADKRGKENYYIIPVANLGHILNKVLEMNKIVAAKYDKTTIYDAVKDADIVHIMIPVFIARKTAKLLKSLDIPISAGFHAQAENLTAHLGMKNFHFANHLTYLFYNKNLYKYVDGIHYPTQFIRDYFEKEIKKTTNGYVISNGVNDIYRVRPSVKPKEFEDKFCILFTGRYSKEKSHMVLLKAIEKSKYKDKIQLICAGDGPLKKKLVKYSEKHLTNMPMFNFFTREELLDVINYSDLYCHPAEIEIEAISCLEAICCGLVPVIANSPRCATKAFAIDERSLFKVNDSDDLAQKIDYFIENPDEKEKLKKQYLENSTAFDQEHCMELMEKMLFDLVEKHKAKANEKN
ncbi:MAG: glycosyltransferase [Erysipelotrichales bacterium]|nr:glycosyltransferase [Erysipelotrichales bacterium]